MTNRKSPAVTYADNVRETRAHYHAQMNALYELWLASDMSAVERDRRMAGLRAQLAHYLTLEAQLYRLNAGMAA